MNVLIVSLAPTRAAVHRWFRTLLSFIGPVMFPLLLLILSHLRCSASSVLHVQGLENSLCVMRNLSYQLYAELPPSVRLRLEGPRRATSIKDSEAIGCFTLYSKKDTEVRSIRHWQQFCSFWKSPRQRRTTETSDVASSSSQQASYPSNKLPTTAPATVANQARRVSCAFRHF